jgi:hypothetical protein
VSVLFEYQYIEDESGARESATFGLEGTDVETVVAFYERLFFELELISVPFQAGESIVLNIADPTDLAMTGAVQVAPTDGKITLNQERSVLPNGAGSNTIGSDNTGADNADAGMSDSTPAESTPDGSGDAGAPDTSEAAPERGDADSALVMSGTTATVDWARVTPTFV